MFFFVRLMFFFVMLVFFFVMLVFFFVMLVIAYALSGVLFCCCLGGVLWVLVLLAHNLLFDRTAGIFRFH